MLPPVLPVFSVLAPLLLSERVRPVLISRLDTTGGWFVPEMAVSGHRDHFTNLSSGPGPSPRPDATCDFALS